MKNPRKVVLPSGRNGLNVIVEGRGGYDPPSLCSVEQKVYIMEIAKKRTIANCPIYLIFFLNICRHRHRFVSF